MSISVSQAVEEIGLSHSTNTALGTCILEICQRPSGRHPVLTGAQRGEMASRSHPANEARAAAPPSNSVSLPVPLTMPLTATGTAGGELRLQPANNKANGMKPNGMGMKTVGHSRVWKTDAHAGGTEQTCNTGHGSQGGDGGQPQHHEEQPGPS